MLSAGVDVLVRRRAGLEMMDRELWGSDELYCFTSQKGEVGDVDVRERLRIIRRRSASAAAWTKGTQCNEQLISTTVCSVTMKGTRFQ